MKQRRWMKSVIAAAQGDLPALPYQRGHRPGIAALMARRATSQLRRA